MKFSIPSILLVSTAWTVHAIPTAIPSSLGGRARGLPYNAVRSVHQSQRKLARQESTATGDVPVPDVTSVADIPTTDPLPPTSVAIVTSEPAEITSVTDIPTSEPLPPITTSVIVSEPTEITSVADNPTTEPLLPPTTTDATSSEAIIVPQTFLVKVRQETEVATPSPTLGLPTQPVTPIETFPATPTANIPTAVPTIVETFPATPTANIPTAVPTIVETNPATPTANILTAVPTAAETFVESPTADLQTDVPTAVETFVARSPYTDTASPPTTTIF